MPELSPAIVALFTATGVAIWVAIRAFGRRAPGSSPFFWLMVALAGWSATGAFHQLTPSLAGKIAWAQALYIAVVSVPPLWLLFAATYSEAGWVRDVRRVAALWVLPATALVVVFARYELLWPSVSLTPDGGSLYTHGWVFYAIAGYSYVMLLAGSYYLLGAMRLSPPYRAQFLAILVAAVVPWGANIVYVGGFVPPGATDPTPLAFTVSGLLLAWALYRRSLFDLVPVARDRVLDTLDDGVLVVDGSRRVLDMNAAARRLAGNDQPWLGRPLDEVFPFLNILPSDRPLTMEVTNGSVYHDVRVTPVEVRFSRQAVSVVLLRDVTEQRRAAEEREQLVRRKSDFVATVSHELRTPLFSIHGALQLLVGGPSPLGPQDRRLVQIALSSCERLTRITNEILDVSRMDARRALEARREPLPAERVIGDALFDVGGMARAAAITIETEFVPAMPLMLGDHGQLVQVLINLLSNAVKFSPAGARITVRAAFDDTHVTLSVRDRGRGIDSADVERLFDRYHRVRDNSRPAVEGVGLGLAIARDIVQQHGGRISVISAPGQGATFTVWVPRAPGESRVEGAAPLADALTGTKVGPAHVLVVDDDEDVRDVVAEALERARFTVTRAAGGGEALERLAAAHVDLLVLDLHMPGINGYEVLRELRARQNGARVPVIVLSGNADSARTDTDIGADALLTKPADLRRLVSTVNELLAGHGGAATSARG